MGWINGWDGIGWKDGMGWKMGWMNGWDRMDGMGWDRMDGWMNGVRVSSIVGIR